MIKFMVIVSLCLQAVVFPVAFLIEKNLIELPVWTALVVGGVLLVCAVLGGVVSLLGVLFIPEANSPGEHEDFARHLLATFYFIWVAIIGVLTLYPNMPSTLEIPFFESVQDEEAVTIPDL
jgi:hypothetical protein